MSDRWQATMTSAQQLRQHLHANPELGWQEFDTAERIRSQLTRLKIPWKACASTGTIASLTPRTISDGTPHRALRGDIDALPIQEATTRPWASQRDGCMHACGHDGHTATLMATAEWLKLHEDQLPGPVSLLFQPAEEGGHGALRMIEDGALDGVDEIYGWHNWPAIPFGQLACPDGIVMCGNGTFTLTVTGRGGHASQPELTRDPVLAASAIVMSLQQICSRRLAPQQAAVISVTSIDARSAPTVTPEKAVIGGSIRVPDLATRKIVNQLISEICQATAASYGVKCEVDIQPRYEATINHAAQAARTRTLWGSVSGAKGLADIRLPIMASEDFSYYLQHIPGAFALIGADDGEAHQAPCHSAHYDFNDRLIPLVTRLFSQLVGVEVSTE